MFIDHFSNNTLLRIWICFVHKKTTLIRFLRRQTQQRGHWHKKHRMAIVPIWGGNIPTTPFPSAKGGTVADTPHSPQRDLRPPNTPLYSTFPFSRILRCLQKIHQFGRCLIRNSGNVRKIAKNGSTFAEILESLGCYFARTHHCWNMWSDSVVFCSHFEVEFSWIEIIRALVQDGVLYDTGSLFTHVSDFFDGDIHGT